MSSDSENIILEQIKKAISDRQPVNIIGGNSKAFYGRVATGEKLEISHHSGVVNYEPSELVISVKAGTKINEIEDLLAKNKQMLGFEPPFCNQHTTIGGVIAAGLSGPRRPYSGAVRDFILGVKMINGMGEVLKFGGQVMKNVAGFDHSRLMAGSLGTLGVLLEVSLRIIPVPEDERTLSFDHPDPDQAIKFMNRVAGKPHPISAAAWCKGRTRIRLSGTIDGLNQAIDEIGGGLDKEAAEFWSALKDHRLKQFQTTDMVYRVSMPSGSASLTDINNQIVDWGGAQRWIFDINQIDKFNNQIQSAGGTLGLFRGGDRNIDVFAALDCVSVKLHQNIKQAFDPLGIFNPGRMYQGL